MSESTKKLIQLLNKDLTVEAIKQEMHLTNKQLIYHLELLKYKGYMIHQNYYGNGDITISLTGEYPPSKYTKIITKEKENAFRSLVISDLHYFHEKENRIAIDNAFNYCIKNGIHIIFICGDLIDCMENNETTIEEQIEKFTELYPYDNSIINFCVLGNHDIIPMKKIKIDFKRVIQNKRLDIVPLNYVEAGIFIKNDKLFLKHKIKQIESIYSEEEKKYSLTYIGHSHTTKICKRCKQNVYVPSLSNVSTSDLKNFKFVPQALDTTLYFDSKDRTIYSVIIDQLLIEESPYIISEHTIYLHNPNPLENNIEIKQYPSLIKRKK